MTILQSSINWVITNFEERLGDSYVYGGFYSPTDIQQGCDCSGCAGWVLEALVNTPANMDWQHDVSTESWAFDYTTNAPAAPGTLGPYGTISVGSDPSQLPTDAALWVNIMHGGGGVSSHMNTMLPTGFIMESNGTNGTCTNGTGGADQSNSEWTDHWYLPGPVTADVAPITPTPPPPATPVLYGIDVSNNNFGGPTNPNLSIIPGFVAEVVKESFSWIEAKVSEGSTFTDPTFSTIYEACIANDIICVGYHFVSTDDPAAQAQNFKNSLNGVSVPVMLDWEQGTWAQYEAVWQAFVNIGLTPEWEYIPEWYWQENGSPNLAMGTKLVASDWVNGTGFASAIYPGAGWAGWNAYGGQTPVILQFTNQAQVAGMTLDADAFLGSLSDLQNLLGIGDGFLSDLTTQQQQDVYNGILMLLQAVTGNLNPSLGQFLLPGSPTPIGSDWGPEPNLIDQVNALGTNSSVASLSTQVANVLTAVNNLASAVASLSADFSTTQTGLAVLSKLAELNSLLTSA